MRFKFLSITILFFSIHLSSAQSRFGIEFKGSRSDNHNSGQLIGESTGYTYYLIFDESNLVTYSQSLGMTYRLNDRNIIKLHLGAHQNGEIISYSTGDDVGNFDTHTNVGMIYHYFQLSPSYCYRLINKKLIIPIEAGININKTTNEVKTFTVPIREFNFDYKISSGLDYRITPDFIIGLRGIYTANINEYQYEFVIGTYKPKQLGVELSIHYEFPNGDVKSDKSSD